MQGTSLTDTRDGIITDFCSRSVRLIAKKAQNVVS